MNDEMKFKLMDLIIGVNSGIYTFSIYFSINNQINKRFLLEIDLIIEISLC